MPPTQKVYPANVDLEVPIPPPVSRPAKYPRPSTPSVSIAQIIDTLGPRTLRRCSWRHGTRGKLTARFVVVQVRIADGVLISHGQHLPGQLAWLVCEARSTGERKYYFTNHPVDTPRMTLVRAIKARWVCKQTHQKLKDELGLDQYEDRSWLGLHHHALLTMIALNYLQHRRLASPSQAGKKWVANRPAPPPQPLLPALRRVLIASLRPVIYIRCPQCNATMTLHQRE